MVYLYAGLGIAMLSGIMAIFEMGLAVTGQSFFRNESRYYTEYLSPTNRSDNCGSDNCVDDQALVAKIQNGAWKTDLMAQNPAFVPSCRNYPAPGNISWDRVSVSLCESNRDGRRIVVDIRTDEVVYVCFPKEPNGQCSFEE